MLKRLRCTIYSCGASPVIWHHAVLSAIWHRWTRLVFTRESRMLRASLPSSVCPSVCLSVCLSIILVNCIKTVQARITESSLCCPKVSSLSWQNFVPLGAGVPLERGRRRGVPPKKTILPLLARIMWKRFQIGTYMLLIITSTGDKLFEFMNIDDLERPWTPQR